MIPPPPEFTRTATLFPYATLCRSVHRVYLVSHAGHMPRAMLSFEAAGLEPIPAPTRFLLPGPLIWRDFLPTVGAMNVTYYAVHEWLGLAWYRLRAD